MSYPFMNSFGSLGFKMGGPIRQKEDQFLRMVTAQGMIGQAGEEKPKVTAGKVVMGLVVLASFGLSAYHGTKRNCGSVGWGIVWGFLGSIAPVLTPIIGFAQGFGKPLPYCGMMMR